MDSIKFISRGALALALAAFTLGAPRADAAGGVVVPNTNGVVVVEGLQSNDSMVSGVLVNQTDFQLKNVEIMLSESFFWKDALHPGKDDPGDATKSVVPGPIPPRGTVPFRLDRARVSRPDGSFLTRVDVVGLTIYETPARRSDAR
jgi:hypothetical protein